MKTVWMTVWVLAVIGCDRGGKVIDADTAEPAQPEWLDLDAQIAAAEAAAAG